MRDVVTTADALRIVLALAFDNVIAPEADPDEYQRQITAIAIVERIVARYMEKE